MLNARIEWPFLRHMEAAVVVQVQRREAQCLRQHAAMVVTAACPLAVAHAQAVHQHQQLAPRCGKARRQRCAVDGQRHAFAAQRHGDGQRVAAVGQVVAPHAVERSDEGIALGRGRGGRGRAFGQAQRGIDTVADPAQAAAHRAVDQTGQARTAPLGRGAFEADARRDAVMHGLHQVGDAEAAGHAQAQQAAQVGTREGLQFNRCRWPACAPRPRRRAGAPRRRWCWPGGRAGCAAA